MKLARPLRTTAAVLSAGVLLGGATACGEALSGDQSGEGGMPVVTFGTTQDPSSIGTVVAVIENRALDEQCGIDIQPQYFSPDAVQIALLSGRTDTAFFGYNSWAKSEEAQTRLSLLAPLQTEHSSLIVPEDSPVQSLEDLRGQRIAMLPPVSAQHQHFAELTALAGMNLNEDFQPVTGPPPAIEAFLQRGEVDAALVFEPNATNLLRGGGYRAVFRLNEEYQRVTGAPLHMLAVTANSRWLEDHGQEAECVVTAVREATRLLAEDPATFESVRSNVEAENDQHLSQIAENLGRIYVTEDAQQAEPEIRAQLEEAHRFGVIPGVPDQIFTPTQGN